MKIIKCNSIEGIAYWVRHWGTWYWVTDIGIWVKAVPEKEKK